MKKDNALLLAAVKAAKNIQLRAADYQEEFEDQEALEVALKVCVDAGLLEEK